MLEGDDVSLTCQTAGQPQDDTVYTWYKDSQRLQDTSDHLLALPHVTSAATGSYHCRARGPSGTSMSPAVTLHVSCEWDRVRWDRMDRVGMGWDEDGAGEG